MIRARSTKSITKELSNAIASFFTSSFVSFNVAKAVPPSMRFNSLRLRNVWGGDVYVGTYNIANAPSFAIQYNHVPRDECAKLVMQTATGFEQVVVGSELPGDTGNIIKDGTGRGVVFGMGKTQSDDEVPLDAPNVIAACNKGNNAFILYKFF